MAWLRSEQSLLHHPKTVHLKTLLEVETATVIGRLHMLWWWCLDYAIDGDLSRKEVKVIEDACQVPLKLLVRAGFIDSRPYRRIHDWWQIQGNYFKIRYRDQPEMWMRIRDSYEKDLPMGKHMGTHRGKTVGNPMDVDRGRTDVEYGRTDVKRKDARETAQDAPLAGAALAPNGGENGGRGIGSTEQPTSQFELDHLARRLTPAEKTMSRLREVRVNGKA